MAVILPAIVLAAMVFALVDIIMRNDWQVKHLPKFGWVILVVLLPLIGTLLWFTIGREYSGASPLQSFGTIPQPRAETSSPPIIDTSSTEQQLAELDREIEYYRRRAELERLKREADGEQAPGG